MVEICREHSNFKTTSQSLADQVRTRIKKGWFSDLEIIEMNQKINGQQGSHHHHHIVLAARISLTLSRHSFLSFIALGRSSGQHPVSSHSCWMYVRAGRPAFARPCVGIHKSTSLMSSSLLLQQCPACLVLLTWIDFVIGGRWPYSWCLVGCRCQKVVIIHYLAHQILTNKYSPSEMNHQHRKMETSHN